MQGKRLVKTIQFTGSDLPTIVYDTLIRLVAAPGLPLTDTAMLPGRPLREPLQTR